MWSDALPRWYAARGRHHLPWRHDDDPWTVLVSEVMLQQTPANRVLPRWERFVARWPTSQACAGASLDDVLREWQGLGYPRRARALWLTAARVAAAGWPQSEEGLRRLPGVGPYTARALLAFSSIGADAATPPRDVNLARVAARAGLGCEPQDTTPRTLDGILTVARPASLPIRDYAYALFDVGVAHCRALPRCDSCPLSADCAWRSSGARPQRPRRRQPAYPGSDRQLRGAVLAHVLAAPDATAVALCGALSAVREASPERVSRALRSLVADGLVSGEHPALR